MATDAQGNLVPANPGYKRIVGANGVSIKEEETIFLGPSIAATPVAGGTQLDAAGGLASLAASSLLGNLTGLAAAPVAVPIGGNAIGGLVIPVHLDHAILTAATAYASPAITPGLYKSLRFRLKTSAISSTAGDISLTGLTGTYSALDYFDLALGPTLAGDAAVATWKHYLAAGNGKAKVEGDIDIETGFVRYGKWTTFLVDGGAGPLYRFVQACNDDTTHDVTGMAMTFTGGNVTGVLDLWGL